MAVIACFVIQFSGILSSVVSVLKVLWILISTIVSVLDALTQGFLSLVNFIDSMHKMWTVVTVGVVAMLVGLIICFFVVARMLV